MINFNSIAIRKGHNCPPFDTGAVAILKESDVTKAVGNLVIEKLFKLGKNVIDVTPPTCTSETDSLAQGVNHANNSKTDLFLSIHCNTTPGGFGSETYSMSPAGASIGQAILPELAKLGFNNRGLKGGARLYEIHNTHMPACLVELFFLDSAADVELYNKLGAEAIADAIVMGLCGRTIVSASPTPTVIPHLVRVMQKGNVGTDVETLQKRLNALGFNCGAPDSIFGNMTFNAVTNFQKSKGLVTDGIVGAKTWGALYA